MQDRVGCRSTDPSVVHANVLEPILATENIIFYDNIEVNRKEVGKIFVSSFFDTCSFEFDLQEYYGNN